MINERQKKITALALIFSAIVIHILAFITAWKYHGLYDPFEIFLLGWFIAFALAFTSDAVALLLKPSNRFVKILAILLSIMVIVWSPPLAYHLYLLIYLQ